LSFLRTGGISQKRNSTRRFFDFQEETNYLHANLVQKAIKRATDDIDNCVDRLAEGKNTSKPEYDTFSIVYDKLVGKNLVASQYRVGFLPTLLACASAGAGSPALLEGGASASN
jgi:hypothetical protein